MTNSADLITSVDNAVNRVRTRAVDVSFNELFDMYKSQELVIDPEFQRLFRWSAVKQSQFIESLILELPIPPIYVIEIQDGIYELIDGLQRISSYLHFRGINTKMNNPNASGADGSTRHDGEDAAGQGDDIGTDEADDGPGHSDASSKTDAKLVLVGCDVLPEINDLTYTDLPHALQIKLKRHFIRMEVLRRESDKRLRYHMFKRLNTGGALLSPQEIRNCTIRLLDTTFIDFIQRLSKNKDYIDCMSRLSKEKRDQMYMEEFVLRFFALKNNLNGYVKDIGAFLTQFMENVSDPEHEITFDYSVEETIFCQTFNVLNRALGDSAFSGYNKHGNPMNYFSALHFEAFTLGIQEQLAKIQSQAGFLFSLFKQKLIAIKTDAGFQKLTTGGGKNYNAGLRQRIDFVRSRVAQ